VVDIHERESLPYFKKGSLFWKFLKDGVIIAFYPVFGEVIFFYLLNQDLKKELDNKDHVSMLQNHLGDLIEFEEEDQEQEETKEE